MGIQVSTFLTLRQSVSPRLGSVVKMDFLSLKAELHLWRSSLQELIQVRRGGLCHPVSGR